MKQPLALMLVVLLAAQASAADFRSATAHLKAQQPEKSRRGINFKPQNLRLRETHLALELRWGFNLPEGELASGVLEGKYVLNEVDGVAGTQRRYHYGGTSALGISDAQGSRFLNLDALGSPTQEMSSATGAVSKVRQTDAWGRYRNGTAPGASDAKYGFTGHQFDPESGLTYARARYYDSETGRMLSRDLVDGEVSNAPSLHAYAWAFFNPLRYTDFDGLSPEEAARQLQERIAALKGIDPRRVVLNDRPTESAYGLTGAGATVAGYASSLAAGIENAPSSAANALVGFVRNQLGLSAKERAVQSLKAASVVGLVPEAAAGAYHAMQSTAGSWVESVASIDEGDYFKGGQKAPILETALTVEGLASAPSVARVAVESSGLGGTVLMTDVRAAATSAVERYGKYVNPSNYSVEAGATGMSGGNVKVKFKPPPSATKEGVIYLRRDTSGALKDYVGQAESPERFLERQTEHAGDYPKSTFEFHELDRAAPGSALDVAEESWIRAGGGPTNKSNPSGGLSNKRYQMTEEEFKAAGGTVPKP